MIRSWIDTSIWWDDELGPEDRVRGGVSNHNLRRPIYHNYGPWWCLSKGHCDKRKNVWWDNWAKDRGSTFKSAMWGEERELVIRELLDMRKFLIVALFGLFLVTQVNNDYVSLYNKDVFRVICAYCRCLPLQDVIAPPPCLRWPAPRSRVKAWSITSQGQKEQQYPKIFQRPPRTRINTSD